jgi:hypothetical protein
MVLEPALVNSALAALRVAGRVHAFLFIAVMKAFGLFL